MATQVSAIHGMTFEDIERMPDETEKARAERMVRKEVPAHAETQKRLAGKLLLAAKAWGMPVTEFAAMVERIARNSKLETLLIEEVNSFRAWHDGVLPSDIDGQAKAKELADAIAEAAATASA